MPKKYVPIKRGKTVQYDEAQLQAVVDAVREKGWSVRRAADIYHVPRSTLGTACLVALKLESVVDARRTSYRNWRLR
ncbi:hypothetical protein DPMN_000037 [Dreissena polymorpha]|uniref:HTH psq-type domain-containing protein n=1 Tax=Dreissena polymorpha TaxID=45954 RepID=A0A9D4MH93_DREPO|nr:hypothetical protein DPMN_000005 [Dreissena polymorpha]KAH3876201.1 hypothetical protein DPMN_000037 [Dreissena polymorpha]